MTTVVVPYALFCAVVTTALNKAIGFYHDDAARSVSHLLALAFLSLLLTAPVAYAIFGELPKDAPRYELLQLAAVLAVSVTVAIRIYAARRAISSVTRRRDG